MNKGTIIQIIGPVVDVEFAGAPPAIFNALHVQHADGTILTLEVAQHVGGGKVRSVAMSSTDGLKRGVEVVTRARPSPSLWDARRSGACSALLGKRLTGEKTS